MDIAWVVAALEAAAIVALIVVWRVSVRKSRSLERRLRRTSESTRRRRRAALPTPEAAVKAVWETATLVRDKGVTAALRHSINDIAGWAEVERSSIVELAGVDGCVAIAFSDIEGSTALNDKLGDRAWNAVLKQHEKVVAKCVARHHGHIVKNQGDGYLLAFATAEQSVRCAIGIQRALAKQARPVRVGPSISVRMGIHYGSVVHRDNDIFGRNVAFAARVAGLAEGGEVLVSGEVVDQLADVDDLDLRLTDLRGVELRGLSGEHAIATLDWRD